MCPEAAMPAEQQERDIGPLQPPVGEGWRNLTGRLVAAQLVVQLGSAAPARDFAVRGQQADGSPSATAPERETAEFQPAQAATILSAMGAAQQVTAIL
ncbi:unnamed protein product [Lampetra planeri]